ncbi:MULTISPECIES: efflux RND transporter periplasmic adaptor subunit [unclassified Duganella]|uniref:efflux RND transporter periplasmic adaptor subunit n=1 Tax=unclassified Duganella TaxID=2636909 RepID=UPI000E3579FE|nr:MULTISPECIES: efflux RND transporter periplasmic adaptor subunit [unclassified Duganella]RFP19590.1 efflux RND transporter periplasmic adaptor subunit [Duganella sp. BJB475]RFP36619.1 efflux RND transporter periplasmic adaptor subunit [Duganella sp. BJB476]
MESQAKPSLNATPPQRSRRSKVIGSVIAVAAMAGLGGLAWYLTHQAPSTGAPGAQGAGGPPGPGGPGGPGGAGGRRGGAATTVGVATADKADIPVTLEALGTVTAAATTTVRPQVSGILQQVLFKEGQMVKAGQVLAQIDPRQFEMALLQSSGNRQRDEAQLENAKLTLNRYRTLLGQDSIARQDVDTQAALVKQLEGTVMTDRAQEGTARLNLGYTKVIAPITGRVGLRVVDIGNLVSSGDANGLAVITQLSPIDVEFSIPQDSVPMVMQQVNGGAQLPAIALDRTRTNALDNGKFAAMDNQVDVQTGTVKAKARFANAKSALFPSQFVNVRLELRTIKDAVMVPVTAVRHGATGDFVYVLKEDKTVTVRPVTRGQATVDKVQIASGLQVGEQVITEGGDRLKEGAKVTLPGAGGGKGKHDGAAGGAGGWKGKRDGAPADAAASAPAASAADAASAPADGERRHHRKEQGAAQQ